ncbi:hypothetical protein [Plastoroseomonas hellenica]|uniref:hypothetical protein n=1 Tax=Plastoroseomonas hellenica TaxID=2687306 RepID=UPI001BA8B8F3|nr:hypothetical protein [Plastoroseomonas hellenica]MBR0646131.1 hypothetical protein [Plastoroseomonas hellenica]
MAPAANRQGATPIGEPGPQEGRHWLDAEWTVLPAEALPGLPGAPRCGKRRFVLLHPVRGVAILDIWPSAGVPEETPESLDAELQLAGFLRRLDPRLPALRIHLAETELPNLPKVLARTYAGTGPLELPEGDAWIAAVHASLAAPVPAAGRARPRRLARRHHLAAGFAVLAMLTGFGLFFADGQIFAEDTQPSLAPTSAFAGVGQAPSGPDEARPAPLAPAGPERPGPEPMPTETASAEQTAESDAIALPLTVASREGVAAEALAEPDAPPPVSTAAPPAASSPAAGVAGPRTGTLLKPFGRPIPVFREARPTRFTQAQEQKPPRALRR